MIDHISSLEILFSFFSGGERAICQCSQHIGSLFIGLVTPLGHQELLQGDRVDAPWKRRWRGEIKKLSIYDNWPGNGLLLPSPNTSAFTNMPPGPIPGGTARLMLLRCWALMKGLCVSIKYHLRSWRIWFQLLHCDSLTVHTVSLTFSTILQDPNKKGWVRVCGKERVRGGHNPPQLWFYTNQCTALKSAIARHVQ